METQRLAVDVPMKLYQEAKILAVEQRTTLRALVAEWIQRGVMREHRRRDLDEKEQAGEHGGPA